jgi:hypothetical protein
MLVVETSAMSDSCHIQLRKMDDKVVAEIPTDVVSAMSWSEDQTLQLINLDHFGVLLSDIECSEIEEIEVILEELKRATREAHQAVNSALGEPG